MAFGLTDLLIIVCTLSIYSLLYKNNPFSVWAEHTFVGMAQAYAFAIALDYIRDYAITPLSKGNYWAIIPVILGLMTYFRFVDSFRWLARFPVALSIAVGMGVSLRAMIQAQFLSQISATILPLFVGGDMMATFGNIVIVLAVVTSITFFYFSKPHEGALGAGSKIGYYFLYIAFGIYFGNVYMGRVALFNGRMGDLLAPERLYVSILVAAVILVTVYVLDKKKLLAKSIGYES
jgi:hypothetical protein